MIDYMRGLSEEKFEQVLMACIDKVEKNSDKDWQDIVEEFDLQIHRDVLRKAVSAPIGAYPVYKFMESKRRKTVDTNDLTMLEEKEIAIKEERVRLNDVRRKLNKVIREKARSQANLEAIKEVILELNDVKPMVYTPLPERLGLDNEAVLVISDTHIGLKIDNCFNKYSVEIAKQRLEKLVSKTVEKCNLHRVGKLHVLIVGDLISGAIHKDLVADADISLVDSVIKGSEIIADTIHMLSTQIQNVEVYFAVGNHSRINPNKAENLSKDNFEYLMFDFIKLRLKDVNNVSFNVNTYHDEIIDFEVFGRKILAVHGDKDKPKNIAKNMTQFLDVKPMKIYLGHYHHYESVDCNGTVVTVNGSLVSTDNYAFGLRLNSEPYQVLTIFNSVDQDEECEYRLKVK